MPHLNELNEKYKSQGVYMLGVGAATASKEKSQEWVDKNGAEYPNAIDDNNRTFQAYGVNSIPRSVVIDPDGKLIYNGHPNGLEEQLKTLVEKYPDLAPGLIDAGMKKVATLREAENYYESYKTLQSIAERFGKTEGGAEAKAELKRIEADEAEMDLVRKSLLDRVLDKWLAEADEALIYESYMQARDLAEKIIEKSPESKQADKARDILRKAKRMLGEDE